MVVDEDQDDLDALLDGDGQLGVHHQERRVARHHEDLAARVRRAWRRCRPRSRSPSPSSRTRPGSSWNPATCHSFSRSPGRLPAELTTTSVGRWPSTTAPISEAWVGSSPATLSYRRSTSAFHHSLVGGDLGAVLGAGVGSRRGPRSSSSSTARASPVSGDSRRSCAVHLEDVDVDEPDVRILERRLRRGGEVGVASADTDDHVGGLGHLVGALGSGDARSAEAERVLISSACPCRTGSSATGMPVCSANRAMASSAWL